MRFFSRRRPGANEVQALYHEHGPALLLYACSLIGRKHVAEDVLQEVFMELLQHGTVPEEPKSYLFRAVHNRSLNQIRQEHQDIGLSEIEPWFESPGHDPAAQMTLQSGLLQLAAEQRQVLALHVWGGLSFAEVGDVLEVSANTAASRYRYALQKLREIMRDKDSTCP
jgi:RNA polymerase sigma-70 factor (ECF subfamily)